MLGLVLTKERLRKAAEPGADLSSFLHPLGGACSGRNDGRPVAGGGLVVDGRLGHLVAFPRVARRSTRAMREPVEEVY